jgi:radical SAM superfamily enzyme YgiQ (UPF0313 family)
MELPRRARGDEYLKPGEYRRVTESLRRTDHSDLAVAVVYCFDFRTRLLPFLFYDKWLVPAGVRAVAGALHESGFTNTRIVLQQWTPNFRPSSARLGGRPLDVLMISAMQIHAEQAYKLIKDAWAMGDDRPLIIGGGPKAIYEPYDFFALGETVLDGHDSPIGADVVVTGEEYITLQLLERIAATRGRGESMRSAFVRARDTGALDDVLGLVYEERDPATGQRRLVNTGTQRLLRELDDLPMPVQAFRMLEPKHRGKGLSAAPLTDRQVGAHARIASLVTTHGCKFACNYCPIPAYNQRTFRHKSSARVVREMSELYENFGIMRFFGTDDNAFNDRHTIEDFFQTAARATVRGKPLRDYAKYSTEATEFDVYKNRDLLPLAAEGGLQAIWFGIEDMTAELINKGQTPEKTKELFKLMRAAGVYPMAMMMHHDGQPLYTPGSLYGLVNQAQFLFDAGAFGYQCTIIAPAYGTKVFSDTVRSGIVFKSVGGEILSETHYDGNRVIATGDPEPWRLQLNLIAAYATFYNPVNFLKRMFDYKAEHWFMRPDGAFFQGVGNAALLKTVWEMGKWAYKVWRGPVERWSEFRPARLPIVTRDGRPDTTYKLVNPLLLRNGLPADDPIPTSAAAGM